MVDQGVNLQVDPTLPANILPYQRLLSTGVARRREPTQPMRLHQHHSESGSPEFDTKRAKCLICIDRGIAPATTAASIGCDGCREWVS